MQRDDIVYVRHILDAARKAIIFTQNRTREALDSDEMLSLSLVRLLEIIGEAANSVSVGFQEKYTQIPWKKMIGLRNRLIHGYFDINLDIVWDTIVEDLPPLVAKLGKIIPRE
ncbi:MAG: DUF86 domain-containing protein [Thermodesulfobacteriota bacterium]